MTDWPVPLRGDAGGLMEILARRGRDHVLHEQRQTAGARRRQGEGGADEATHAWPARRQALE